MSEPLPELLDAKRLQAELGISRASAEKIMRQVPSVVIPGLRKSFVRRPDVAALLDSCTSRKIRFRRKMRETHQWAGTASTAPPRHQEASPDAQRS